MSRDSHADFTLTESTISTLRGCGHVAFDYEFAAVAMTALHEWLRTEIVEPDRKLLDEVTSMALSKCSCVQAAKIRALTDFMAIMDIEFDSLIRAYLDPLWGPQGFVGRVTLTGSPPAALNLKRDLCTHTIGGVKATDIFDTLFANVDPQTVLTAILKVGLKKPRSVGSVDADTKTRAVLAGIEMGLINRTIAVRRTQRRLSDTLTEAA